MTDRRREPRIHEYAEVTVKIKSAPDARYLEGKILRSHLTNVSLCGLQMRVDTEIPIGSILKLEIKLKSSPEKYMHVGYVVWKIFKTLDGIKEKPWHNIGISLKPMANPQLDSWIITITDLLESAEVNQS